MKHHRTLTVAALAALTALTGCATLPRPTTPAPAPAVLPPCPARTVHYEDGSSALVVTAEAHTALGCDLVPPMRLDMTWPGADGYDDSAVRAEADHAGCARFAVVDGVATGFNCDY